MNKVLEIVHKFLEVRGEMSTVYYWKATLYTILENGEII